MVNRVSFIGLGLIGGSLAKALHLKNENLEIYALDSDTQALQLARDEGVIRQGFNECCEEIYNSDIIFVCTPVRKAIEYISQLCDKVKTGCIITDVASTKGEICNYINSLSNPPLFVGGHPMAGTEKSGYANSLPHLFENAYYVLAPTKTSSLEVISTVEKLLTTTGAIPIIVSPEQHDLVTGCISHVPHIIASALVKLAKSKENTDGLIKLLAAGGFKDITRIASSNPTMWENIVVSNDRVVTELLNDFVAIIQNIMVSIKSGDNKEIYNFFELAKEFRDSFSARATGLIPPGYELLLDVKDEPGIIGRIATLLGNSGINIKNINVSNSREFEQGCLRITLSDQENTDSAYEILSKSAYPVFRKN